MEISELQCGATVHRCMKYRETGSSDSTTRKTLDRVRKVDRDYVHLESGGHYSRRTGRICGAGGGQLMVEYWIEPIA